MVKYTQTIRRQFAQEKMFWKFAANLQENTRAEAPSHFRMGVLL